jgi:protein O-mannosyl-transferase
VVAAVGQKKVAKQRKAAAPSPRQAEPTSTPGDGSAAILFVGLAFLIYAPVLAAGFIWDDGRAITDNLTLRSWQGLWDIWTGQGDPDFFPLKATVLWLVYQVFGARTPPYHILNVGVHAANAVLLWRVLGRLSIPGAWLAGLIFLVHPTHVESVAWVSECKNTLSLLFALLSLLAWFRYQRDQRGRMYVASLVLFVAGLLCKSTVVILPVVLLLFTWWQHPTERAFLRSRGLPRSLPFFLVAVLLGAVTVWFQFGRAIGEYQLPVGGLASRTANAGKATWWYLAKAVSPTIVWYEMNERPIETEAEAQAFLSGAHPANPAPAWPTGRLTTWPLVAIYPRWRVTPPVWYDFLPAAAMVGLFAWVTKHRNGRGRPVFFALAYFLVALLPALGLLKMSYMRAAWVADHFQYLADIGIIALACAAGTLLWRRSALAGRRLVAAVGVAVVVVFSVCTFARALDYRSEYTLWTDTVAKNPGAWQAQMRLGAALLARNQVREATAHFAQAVRLNPNLPDGHNNLGLGLVQQGQVAEGIAQYRASIRLQDEQFFAHANLADALASQKQYAEAIVEYRSALRWHPTLVPLIFRLGTALMECGQLDEAVATFEKAKALAPSEPEVTTALARAQTLRGQAK